jgi:hypothetical protein
MNSTSLTLTGDPLANNTALTVGSGVIEFSPPPSDVARDLVQLVGVTDALLTGRTQCVPTALRGDTNDDLMVTTPDLDCTRTTKNATMVCGRLWISRPRLLRR